MLHWTVNVRGKPKDGRLQAAVAVGNKLYSFGDSSNEPLKEEINVCIFNTVSLRWRTLPPVATRRGGCLEVPCTRRYHTVVLVEDTIYMWGGRTSSGYCNVIYAFDVDTHRWFKPSVSGTVPEGATYHSACVLEKVMFIHGGFNRTNDIYKLDTTTLIWSLINTRGTTAPASSHHSATIIGTKMFVFGGWREFPYCNTIRVFDTETNCWLNTPSAQLPLEGRSSHSAVAYNGELYIFGGVNYNWEKGEKALKDLWKFSPETFSWKEVKLKQEGPVMIKNGCYCMVGDRIFLFGGCSDDDLFTLDLSPSLKTLCKLAVIQYDLEQSELPHDIRWELAAMTDG